MERETVEKQTAAPSQEPAPTNAESNGSGRNESTQNVSSSHPNEARISEHVNLGQRVVENDEVRIVKPKRKRVVVIGMGFGGLRVVRELAHKDVDVIALDRRNFHLFQPLLYQVATAMLEQEAIAHNIRAIVRGWRNVNFQMSEVKNVDLDARCVITEDGNIPYDYLVLAAGSVTNFFGNEAVQKNAFDLKQLDDAVKLRNHILSVYEQAAKEKDPAKRAALMTFVIVGGGPTGVEFAGALAELTQNILAKDYPQLNVKRSRVILVESGKEVLGPFPRRLQDYARRRLCRMGVKIMFNTYVVGAEPGKVFFKDGTSLDAGTLFWGAGVKASPLAEAIPLPKGRNGRIVVEPDLSIKDHPEAFVIGDLAYLEQDGVALPMVAPVAMQGGEYVAKKIQARIDGVQDERDTEPFRYFDKGSMAVIGRGSAVTAVKGLNMQGFFAWLAWLALHLFYLIGFRNRVMTMINWAYEFLFYDRQVRLITHNEKQPPGESI